MALERLEPSSGVFMDGGLRKQLAEAEATRDEIYSRVQEMNHLITFLRNTLVSEFTDLNMKVDIGSENFVDAYIPDTKNVIVEAIHGFYIQLPLSAAIQFLEQKLEILESQLKNANNQVGIAKGKIRLYLAAVNSAVD